MSEHNTAIKTCSPANNDKNPSSNHDAPEPPSHPSSGTFNISIIEIEQLMSSYKERGSDFKDLKKIKEHGGPLSILQKLKTDAKNGIDSIDNREEDFGSNKVFIEPVPPFCSYVEEALEDLMVRILIIAAVVQIILGVTLGDDPSKDWIDGLSIILAVLVVTLVGSITNYQKENKFHELNEVQNEGTVYKVTRNGIVKDMKSDDLLVGDLVNIMVGDILPTDMLLIDGNNIKIDESALTGESDTMRKENYEKCELMIKEMKNKNNNELSINKIPSPLMLSGTNCAEGTGYGIVLAVGEHSQKGIIKRTVDNAQENNQTPLEQKLESIAENIGFFGMAAGAITLVALTIRFIINYLKNVKEYNKDSAKKDIISAIINNYAYLQNNHNVFDIANSQLTNPKSEISEEVLNIIMLCVSIIVVAIPEGLPLAVTLSLAFSIKKLMDFNNLVRKMHACETMGGANYICTDKTGTLTKNEMNIYKVLTVNSEIILKETLEEEKNAKTLNEKGNKINDKKIREDRENYFKNENYWNEVKTAIALNIDGQIVKFDKPDNNGDIEYCETKNKTDKAFIDFLYRFRILISKEREKFLSNKNFYKQIPFDSKLKRMTTFIKNNSFPTGYRLYTKGGAEKVKEICNKYIDPDTGEIKSIGDQERYFITDNIKQFNKQMLRSLYICYKDISEKEFNSSESLKNLDQTDNIFICCVGIRDSLRNGVREAVEKCHTAGVNVIMVTGDNIVTATAIAKDCNILGKDVDLQNLRPEDIEEDPELTDDNNKKQNHLKNIINNKPKALTGNTFYTAIGGLMCATCNLDSSLCKCPKTVAEAEQLAKKNNLKEIKQIKSDTIKNKKVFYELTKNLKVMARSQPIHKYALVLGLKEMDKIVAVTGDGTNDAPALSKSDVGFAMFAGTDIAKEASDIIILDNNFSSLVIAIIYGRNIYDNIRKFLQFQLTVNFCACLLVFICACIGNETPLTTIQMLWINLIMDSLGSLALATEPPYEELLKREPTRKDESIINGKMWKHIVIQSLVQLILLIFLFLYGPHFIKEDDYVRLAENYIINNCYGHMPGYTSYENIIYGISPKWGNGDNDKLLNYEQKICGQYANFQDLSLAYVEYTNVNANTAHMSIVFNVFVVYTLFNQLNCRVIDDSFNIFIRVTNNFFFPLITIIELALQFILIEVGADAFKCTERGITYKQWGICLGFSAITFFLSIIIKLLPIDKVIQNILDNSKKSNKVANIEDLAQVKKPLALNASEKFESAGKSDDLKKSNIFKESMIMKSMKTFNRNSSFYVGGKSMRMKKIEIYLGND